MNGERVIVAYNLHITLEFDSKGRAQQVINGVTGDLDDYNTVTVWSEQLKGSS